MRVLTFNGWAGAISGYGRGLIEVTVIVICEGVQESIFRWFSADRDGFMVQL